MAAAEEKRSFYFYFLLLSIGNLKTCINGHSIFHGCEENISSQYPFLLQYVLLIADDYSLILITEMHCWCFGISNSQMESLFLFRKMSLQLMCRM